MPNYNKRRNFNKRRNPRRRLAPGTQLARIKRVRRPASLVGYSATRAAGRALPAMEAAQMAYEAARHATNLYNKTISTFNRGQRSGTTALSQTSAVTRGTRRSAPKSKMGSYKFKNDPTRHQKLNMAKGTKMNAGKGFNSTATGTIVTHPVSTIPKWKRDRIYKYKHDIWSTTLLSRSSRLQLSNNTLQVARYPIKMPETMNSERTQCCIFTPFISHLSGTHSSMFRHINSTGDGLIHDTTNLLDVIQNKADPERWEGHTSLIEANDGLEIKYPGLNYTPAQVADASNYTNILRRVNQLVKEIHLDFVITSSRAWPIRASISVVRAIKPQSPYTLTTENTRDLCNGISNHGMDWNTWKTEYHHEFTIQPLKIGKSPPTYSINKKLMCNWLQTNSFNENTTSQDQTQAANTGLGLNLHSHQDEIADGNVSSQFYILIKYHKVQNIQSFVYKQTLATHSNNTAHASIEIPAVSEESFDIPALGTTGNATTSVVAGVSDGATATRGKPFQTDQGNEATGASFYLNGKIRYRFGYTSQTESIPSVMSMTDTDSNYKKPLSLMIDPTYDPTNTTYGIYQQSPDHVNIAASTANTGI